MPDDFYVVGDDVMSTTRPLDHVSPDTVTEVQEKYLEERDKRIRPDGLSQFIDLCQTDKFSDSREDPWTGHETRSSQGQRLENDSHVKFLVIGAGYGGLLFAVRLRQAGISADDIRIVDSAGGFGGTWYWNRYPGLICDVESYIYMPLLEETGHMPKHKYSHGSELCEHAYRIAEKYELSDKAVFKTTVQSLTWRETSQEWAVKLRQSGDHAADNGANIQVQADFVIAAPGLLNNPQMPRIPGIDEFEGQIFHTSRWNYEYTGGSPTDPRLGKLKGKRVGIVGTGATAIQVIPHLAREAGHLYVFQRTPSSIDTRGQKATIPETWKSEIANKPGWQRERMENFNAFLSNMSSPTTTNLVNDQWTRIPSYSALFPKPGIITPEMAPTHLAALHALDLTRSERLRARVDEEVKDEHTAEKLKAWYPTWCKRPCFHDDYLPVFNRGNVTLVDTGGQGIESLTSGGVVARGTEHPLDLLILGTGYRSPLSGGPGSRANMTITGRDGRSLDDTWASEGVGTLHGVMTNGFPNFFFPGPSQAGATANYMFMIDELSEHVAYIISHARRAVGDVDGKVVIEPTKQAQEEWTDQVVMRVGSLIGLSGCTPGYLNLEGESDRFMTMEDQIKLVKGALWGEGVASYVHIIKEWRKKGDLQGLRVTF